MILGPQDVERTVPPQQVVDLVGRRLMGGPGQGRPLLLASFAHDIHDHALRSLSLVARMARAPVAAVAFQAGGSAMMDLRAYDPGDAASASRFAEALRVQAEAARAQGRGLLIAQNVHRADPAVALALASLAIDRGSRCFAAAVLTVKYGCEFDLGARAEFEVVGVAASEAPLPGPARASKA